jgi:Methyltransferase FkbM domain
MPVSAKLDIRGALRRLRFRTPEPTRPPVSSAGNLKASSGDFLGRFREIVSDPLNLLIERDPRAGTVEDGLVWLHNGNRVPASGPNAYYGRFSEILIINRGVHEPLEEYVFQELLCVMPEEPMMLELGAYWGHYSMWMKSRHPRSRVFMVEPEAQNLEAGRTNFARHGYEGAFIQALVGKQNFEVDRFMREQGYPRLDILHCDIQGFELEMLEGAVESFQRELVDYAFISTHSQSLHDSVLAKLTAAGMRIEVSSGFDLETTSFDGFVLASRVAIPPAFPSFSPLGRCDLLQSTPARLVSYLAAQRDDRTPALS